MEILDHILLNIKPYISNDRITKIWGNGFSWWKKVYNVDNLGAYISKYLTKGAVNNSYFGQKKFFSSKNLFLPVVFDYFKNVSKVLKKLYFLRLFPKISFSVETEFLGLVKYRQYVL